MLYKDRTMKVSPKYLDLARGLTAVVLKDNVGYCFWLRPDISQAEKDRIGTRFKPEIVAVYPNTNALADSKIMSALTALNIGEKIDLTSLLSEQDKTCL